MTYVKITEDGNVLHPYNVADLKRDNPDTSFPSDLAGVDLSGFGVVTLSAARDLLDGVARDALLAAAKAEKLADLASVRWAAETGGIILNGAAINTDRESQGMLNGALALVSADPARQVDWKTVVGWARLDAGTIRLIAFAVGAHVQACFSHERALAEAIAAAADFDSLDAVDLQAGWPA